MGGAADCEEEGDATKVTLATDEAGANTRGPYWVRAVDRTVQLLEVIAADGGRGKALAEAARRAGMPEPSALRYLSTLVRRGLLEREGKGEQSRYRLGLGLFRAGRAGGEPARHAAYLRFPICDGWWSAYQETDNLAVFRQARLVIIEVLEGTRSIRQEARVGQQEQLRSTALGKAVLATCSDEEALSLLRLEVLEKATPHTINTDEGMLRELRAIRSRGYAVDNEEHDIGLRCVAVAIPYRGQSFGLSISGPSHLFSREVVREVGPDLCNVGGELAARVNSQRNVTHVQKTVQATMVSSTWTPRPPDNGTVTSLSRGSSNDSVMPRRGEGSTTAGGRRSCPGHVRGSMSLPDCPQARFSIGRNLVLAGQYVYVTKTVAAIEQEGPKRENESEPWREPQ